MVNSINACVLAMIRGRKLFICSVLLASVLFPLHAFGNKNEAAKIRAFESSLLPVGATVKGHSEQHWTLQQRMEHWNVPGISIAVIRDGKIAWAKGYGVLQAGKADKVDTETVFSAGSVSKVGAAAITLRLVDAGKLDLDKDVNGYLSRWKIQDDIYTAINPVTLRGILSHTAGLSVGGFEDFQPNELLPDVVDILGGKGAAKNKSVEVLTIPGSMPGYSGGGTTLQQLVIEETTGLAFEMAADQYVFGPLGMTRSTYENPIPESHGNIAKAHGPSGETRALPRGYESMPEMAASGLWTTATDYARLVIAIIKSYRGESKSFLRPPTARQMLTEVWPSRVGLGPFLDGSGWNRRFSHSGSNDSYKAYFEGHPNTGNGVVVFTNGEKGGQLIDEVVGSIALVEGWSSELNGHQKQLPVVGISPGELKEMVGVYVEGKGEDLIQRVSYKDGCLYLQRGLAEPGRHYRLIPIDSANFILDGRNFPRIRFVRGYDGQISGMLREYDESIADHELLIFLKKIETRSSGDST